MPISAESIKTLTSTLEGSFKPLRCVSEIYDYNEKIRFKIFDSDNNGILEITDIVIRNFQNKKELKVFIEEIRLQIQERGITLD